MKVLVLLALLVIAAESSAQIPWSPAFDSNVYMPQLGKPGEWDTLHVDWAKDVTDVHNFGPWVNERYGRIALTGYPGNTTSYTAFHTGPDLRLSNLQPIAQMKFTHKGVVCHFRSRSINDLWDTYEYKIYWQLADGTYSDDSTTKLKMGDSLGMAFRSSAYHAQLTNDTTEDLLLFGWDTHLQTDLNKVDYYLLLFRSDHLYDKTLAYPDSMLHIERGADSSMSGISRGFESGDWRGAGRNDAIGYLGLWLSYYRNDPPFSMQKFRQAMLEDTLFSSDEYFDAGSQLTLRALPHHGDTALDLLFPFRPKTTGVFSIFIFKGGPNFGSHRLHLDSADYEMKDPRNYDHSGRFNGMDGWGGAAFPMGDMTGTGRPVIYTWGVFGGQASADEYYVLGDATDDKADLVHTDQFGKSFDTSMTYRYPYNSEFIAKPFLQRLEILHGSNRIPIRINPKFASVRQLPEVRHLAIYPNPSQEVLHCQFEVSAAGVAEFTLFNVLGQQVSAWAYPVGDGEQSTDLPLPELASGQYVLMCRTAHSEFSTSVSIIK